MIYFMKQIEKADVLFLAGFYLPYDSCEDLTVAGTCLNTNIQVVFNDVIDSH